MKTDDDDVCVVDYIQLTTSLLSIFYTTAQLPQQVRRQMQINKQIKTFSMAAVALITWRTLIVGSRIMAFVLFALLFQHWLFVVIGVHYLLMFALVFYQMRFAKEKEKLITRVVYNIVTPLVYIFDYCVNWLEGPLRYWYAMCYVPMYCENVLMSALGLWYVSTTPSPDWYIVPGCICVIVAFPLAVLVQAIYYRTWHPKHTSVKWYLPWSECRQEVVKVNVRTSPLRRSGVDHTVLPANTPHLPSPRSSPEGATSE